MSGSLRCFSPFGNNGNRWWIWLRFPIDTRQPKNYLLIKIIIFLNCTQLCTTACTVTSDPSMKSLVLILLLVSLWKIELFIDYYYLDTATATNLFLSMDSIWISSLNICSLFNAIRILKPWNGPIVVVCIHKFHQFMDIRYSIHLNHRLFSLYFCLEKVQKTAKQHNNDQFFENHIDANHEEFRYFTFVYSPLNWNWRHDANQWKQWTNTHTNRSQMKRTERQRWNRETKATQIWIKQTPKKEFFK